MSWFSRSKTDKSGEAPAKPGMAKNDPLTCTHQALAPRWDRAEDMGKMALATSFVCEKCHHPLTPDEGRAILALRA